MKSKDVITLRELEKVYIIAVYNETKNKLEMSRILGVSEKTIHNKINGMKADGIIEYDELLDIYKFKRTNYERNLEPLAEEPKTETINEICNKIYNLKYANG